MAKPVVGGLRTMGSREVAEAGAESDPSPQLNKQFKYVYQSRKQDFVVSLKRRRVHYMPDGSKEEAIPETTAGARLDMLRFKDHFFRTNDAEIDAAFEEMGKIKPEVFGIDGLCWRYEEKAAQMREARAAEIRKALAEDPELAKAVTLSPSDKKDWDVKSPAVKPVAAAPKKAFEDLSDEEQEAMTAPAPAGRTR
jgi:hypothetical protein